MSFLGLRLLANIIVHLPGEGVLPVLSFAGPQGLQTGKNSTGRVKSVMLPAVSVPTNVCCSGPPSVQGFPQVHYVPAKEQISIGDI